MNQLDAYMTILPALPYIAGVNENISGQVIDTKGKGVQVKLSIVSQDGSAVAGPFDTDASGKFNFVASVSDTDLIKVDAPPGYKVPMPLAMSYTYPDNSYYLQIQEPTFLIIPIALGAGLLLLARKKKKKVGAFDTNTVVTVGIAIAGGYILFNSMHILDSLLQAFGINKSKETQALDVTASSPTSFWNPNFWKDAPNGTYTHAITEQQAQDIISQLYDAKSIWNDDEAEAKGALKQLQTQAELSFVAWELQKANGVDLLEFLRGGLWPNDFLSDADVYEINSYFQGLPKY